MLDHDEDAESRFREAFQRLKDGCPIVLGKGAIVSQANIAKEAGRDPSALRKSRYPSLIEEIKSWISSDSISQSELDEIVKYKNKIKVLTERVKQLEHDRDLAQSLLVQAHDRVVVLSQQNEKLASAAKLDNVHKLR